MGTPGDDEAIAMAAAAEIDGLMEKAGAYKAASALTLDEAMAFNPPSKDPADSGAIKCPLVPSIFSEAPAETAMIYWERSMTFVAPGLAVDTADMVERPVMMWNEGHGPFPIDHRRLRRSLRKYGRNKGTF